MYICVKNTLFHGISRSCSENMDTDTVEITIQWFLSPVMEKAVIRLLITSCELYREFKNYPSISNLFFISKCIERLPSFNSQHSLQIKTYCVPSRVPSTNTIEQKQWYSIYVMQSQKMLNVTTEQP